MITVTPQVQAANDSGQPPIELARFDFAGVPPIFLTTAGMDIDWDGETWLANGFMLESDLLDRVGDLRTSNSKIGLTGVDLSIAAILLNNSQVGRKVTIYEAFLAPSGGVLPDPYVREILFIDDGVIEQGTEDATIVLTLSGEWADFEFTTGIRTTDASLKRFHPDDNLFKYSKDIKPAVKWGGE